MDVPVSSSRYRYDACFAGLTTLDISGRAVSQIPEGGGVDFIDEIRLCPAGTASGALMNAAKLGASCLASACIGDDEKGDFILSRYRKIGDNGNGNGHIDVQGIQRSDAMATSATILPIRPNGDRPAWHQRGASDDYFVTEQEFDTVCDAKILHYGGTGLLAAMDRTGQGAKLLAYAKSKGVVTTLDLIAPNESTLELFLGPILPYVDYFMPSMEEALFISQKPTPEEAASFFFERGVVRACIFKWGAKGSYIRMRTPQYTQSQLPSWCPDDFATTHRLPAFRVEVKDTTGCGDSYCGGFVAGLARGMDVLEACRLGTAASALVATGLGSDAGVVNFESTMKFIKEADIIA